MIKDLPKSLIESARQVLYNNHDSYRGTFDNKLHFNSYEDYIKYRDSLPKILIESNIDRDKLLEAWMQDLDSVENTEKLENDHLNNINLHDTTPLYKYATASTPLNRHLFNEALNGNSNIDKFNIVGKHNFTHDLNHLDHVLNKNKLTEKLITHSGLGYDPSKSVFIDANHDLTLPAYTSTSTNKRIAMSFAQNFKDDDGYHHIMEIHHPVGSTGYMMTGNPHITPYNEENEYIMPRNQIVRLSKTPEINEDLHGNKYKIWKAMRKNNDFTLQNNDTNYNELIEEHDGNKLYNSKTLGAYHENYSTHIPNNKLFNEKLVKGDVYHLHTTDGKIHQIHLTQNGVTSILSGNKEMLSDELLRKYPTLSKFEKLKNNSSPTLLGFNSDEYKNKYIDDLYKVDKSHNTIGFFGNENYLNTIFNSTGNRYQKLSALKYNNNINASHIEKAKSDLEIQRFKDHIDIATNRVLSKGK